MLELLLLQVSMKSSTVWLPSCTLMRQDQTQLMNYLLLLVSTNINHHSKQWRKFGKEQSTRKMIPRMNKAILSSRTRLLLVYQFWMPLSLLSAPYSISSFTWFTSPFTSTMELSIPWSSSCWYPTTSGTLLALSPCSILKHSGASRSVQSLHQATEQEII